jgi:membrane glycosyltransferase
MKAASLRPFLLIVVLAVNIVLAYHVCGWIIAIYYYGQWTLREPNLVILALEFVLVSLALLTNLITFARFVLSGGRAK